MRNTEIIHYFRHLIEQRHDNYYFKCNLLTFDNKRVEILSLVPEIPVLI